MKTKEYWEEEARRRLQSLAREEELFAGYWTKRYLKNLKYLNYLSLYGGVWRY